MILGMICDNIIKEDNMTMTTNKRVYESVLASDKDLLYIAIVHIEKALSMLDTLMFNWYGTPTFNIVKKELLALDKIRMRLMSKQKQKRIIYPYQSKHK